MALHIEVFSGAECTVLIFIVVCFIGMHSNIGKTKIVCDKGSFPFKLKTLIHFVV